MSYKEGIIKSIEDMKDRQGSSMPAIKKYMQANLPSDKKWLNTLFLTTLKTMVEKGELVKVKNHYKLSPEVKKKRADALKPKKPKKKAAPKKKKSSPKKKMATKKKTAPKKKAAPKKKKTAPKKKAATKKKSAPKKKATKKKTASKKQ